MKKSSLKKFATWVGPHDYSFPIVFSWIFVSHWEEARPYVLNSPSIGSMSLFVVEAISIIFLISMSATYMLMLFQKSRHNMAISLQRYVAEILCTTLWVTLLTKICNATVIPWSNRPPYLGGDDKPAFIFARFIASIIFIAATHGLLRRLREELQEAEQRSEMLAQQYTSLIEADEDLRSQASRYLHDRVQSEIMLAASQLKKRFNNTIFKNDEILIEVIDQLEKIRSVDLKMVSQILTPNIEAEGIAGAIENLCAQYSTRVSYVCEFSDSVSQLNHEQSLGIFRIIEQAVINSITHGPATKISIKIGGSPTGFTIEVADNGPGSENPKPGTGTMIIDAWVSILQGHKEITSDSGNGYTLTVRF
jgi:signal transduction histidine kinase